MIYDQRSRERTRFGCNEICMLLKDAFYGNVKEFKPRISKHMVISYLKAFYYCINEGCKREFEFAKFTLDNFTFMDVKYKMSITATYIRNGKYDERLYLDKIDTRLYLNIKKSDIEPILQFEKLKDILYFISVLNSFKIDYENKDFPPVKLLREHYNLPDNKATVGVTDSSLQIIDTVSRTVLYYPKYSAFDLNPYSFASPPGDYMNICNLEGELFFGWLHGNRKESDESKEINPFNIMRDVRTAIESFDRRKYLDECLTKFFLVFPSESLILVERHKPFLVFGNAPFNPDYLNRLLKINPLYLHNFIYSQIMYHQLLPERFIGSIIDYCYIEACIKSCNFTALQTLKYLNKKCYKILDYEEKKYLSSREEIIVNYDEVFNKLKFDPSSYVY